MSAYDGIEIINEYEGHNSKKQEILNDLLDIIHRSRIHLEGNCFYLNGSTQLLPELYTKQVNLYWCGKQAEKQICEIGFNAGHSALLLVLGRTTPLNFTIFDEARHAYMKPCFEYLSSKLTNIKFDLIEGDSRVTMPNWVKNNSEKCGTYDIVHIDGGHFEDCADSDMQCADMLLKVGGIMIVDDTDWAYISEKADALVKSGKYVELVILKTYGYPHRMIRKVG